MANDTPQSALTGAQLAALLAPLNKNRVSQRGQGQRKLSYLEAWDVRATLIRVFGFGNWSADVIRDKVLEINKTEMPPEGGKDAYTRIESCVKATVRLTIHATGATYTESATASQVGRDVGEVTDFALKTAASDALKRCAMNLGTQFGLSLYDDGALADVVRVILDPAQREEYVEHVKAEEARKGAASQQETANAAS